MEEAGGGTREPGAGGCWRTTNHEGTNGDEWRRQSTAECGQSTSLDLSRPSTALNSRHSPLVVRLADRRRSRQVLAGRATVEPSTQIEAYASRRDLGRTYIVPAERGERLKEAQRASRCLAIFVICMEKERGDSLLLHSSIRDCPIKQFFHSPTSPRELCSIAYLFVATISCPVSRFPVRELLYRPPHLAPPAVLLPPSTARNRRQTARSSRLSP